MCEYRCEYWMKVDIRVYIHVSVCVSVWAYMSECGCDCVTLDVCECVRTYVCLCERACCFWLVTFPHQTGWRGTHCRLWHPLPTRPLEFKFSCNLPTLASVTPFYFVNVLFCYFNFQVSQGCCSCALYWLIILECCTWLITLSSSCWIFTRLAPSLGGLVGVFCPLEIFVLHIFS